MVIVRGNRGLRNEKYYINCKIPKEKNSFACENVYPLMAPITEKCHMESLSADIISGVPNELIQFPNTARATLSSVISFSFYRQQK